MPSLEDSALVAETEITLFEQASREYAALSLREQELEAQRPVLKQLAVARLMDTENPLASVAGKKHSASSAEAVVETESDYSAHLVKQRSVVFEKNQAYTRAQSAKFRASLALALLKAEAGVS